MKAATIGIHDNAEPVQQGLLSGVVGDTAEKGPMNESHDVTIIDEI